MFTLSSTSAQRPLLQTAFMPALQTLHFNSAPSRAAATLQTPSTGPEEAPRSFATRHQRVRLPLLTCHAAAAADDSSQLPATPNEDTPKESLWVKFRNFFLGGKLDKERLQKLGVGALISYGFISNVTYGACVTIVWAHHVAATGHTPFEPGQWTGFLGRLAALMALQNILRPMRFTLAVGLTPFVNRLMDRLQAKFNISKARAFGIMMFLLGASTTTAFAIALFLATTLNMPKPV